MKLLVSKIEGVKVFPMISEVVRLGEMNISEYFYKNMSIVGEIRGSLYTENLKKITPVNF